MILEDEEARGGHTIERHVGKTNLELIEHLEKARHRGFIFSGAQPAQGSFKDISQANDFVNQTLQRNIEQVDAVAQGAKPEAILNERFGYETGKEASLTNVDSEPYIRKTYRVITVIRHDSSSERGFKVITAFPTNRIPNGASNE